MGGIARALLSLRGRLRRGQFWLAFFIVFVGGAYSSQDQQAAGLIVGLITLYVALCVYGKRLHDFGKTAWYMIIPLGATFGFYGYMVSVMTNIQSAQRMNSEGVILAGLAILAVWLIVTLWVGIHPSQNRDNRFGMDTSEKHNLPTGPPEDTG